MIKKKDMILIGALLACSVILYLVIQFAVKKDGGMVIVKIDGEVVNELNIDMDTQVTVQGYDGGSNTIVIEGGKVYMKDADCPDKVCEHTGKISKTGETIVCLPHRVVVEISGKQQVLDGVVN